MVTDDMHRETDDVARDPRRVTAVRHVAASPLNGSTVKTGPQDTRRFVGVVTRSVSWVLDALVINLVAIITGLGAQLILSIFPVSGRAVDILKAVAGAAYVVWCAAYFVLFWYWTGQTLGARLMQIRLVPAKGTRVKPVRALVRWVGMNLAMLPLFAGYIPLLFGRRGFPDWLARTEVVEAPQLSLAEKGRAALRKAHEQPDGGAPPVSRGYAPAASVVDDVDIVVHERRS